MWNERKKEENPEEQAVKDEEERKHGDEKLFANASFILQHLSLSIGISQRGSDNQKREPKWNVEKKNSDEKKEKKTEMEEKRCEW